jgi:hypothetical protein
MAHRDWLKNAAQLRHLDELADKVKNVARKTNHKGDAS